MRFRIHQQSYSVRYRRDWHKGKRMESQTQTTKCMNTKGGGRRERRDPTLVAGSGLRPARGRPGEAGGLPQTLGAGAGGAVGSQAAVGMRRRPSFPLRDPLYRHGAPGGLQRADRQVWLPCSPGHPWPPTPAPRRSMHLVPGSSYLGLHTMQLPRVYGLHPI